MLTGVYNVGFYAWNVLISCMSYQNILDVLMTIKKRGARCSSVVRAFAHGVMGCRIDPSWGGPIALFLIPASAPRLVVTKAVVYVVLFMRYTHIKEPLLLIGKSSLCGGSGFSSLAI